MIFWFEKYIENNFVIIYIKEKLILVITKDIEDIKDDCDKVFDVALRMYDLVPRSTAYLLLYNNNSLFINPFTSPQIQYNSFSDYTFQY